MLLYRLLTAFLQRESLPGLGHFFLSSPTLRRLMGPAAVLKPSPQVERFDCVVSRAEDFP